MTGRSILSVALIGFVLVVCTGGCAIDHPDWIAVGRHAMVATDSPYASQIGCNVLKTGGNAIDAATAVSFALAVTRPYSTGLGGGGFLIFRSGRTGDIKVFDFRETAPGAATPDMYEDAGGAHGPEASRIGYLAVGIPGLVAGRVEILERFGTKPLAELIEPSLRLARKGFAVDAHYVTACEEVYKIYQRRPELMETCSYVYQTHLREGNLRKPGELLKQPALAGLLDAIARGGAKVFYRGEIADAFVDTVRRNGGIISRNDLANYRVIQRQPIIAAYRDYELILMPPPSSGGVCLAEALNILEQVDLPAIALRDRPLAVHYMVEAMKHAFADRARWLGDSDFARVPVELLISEEYAGQRLLSPRSHHAGNPEDRYGVTQLPDDAGTSHFCVVDRWGNVVVSTETINTSFGALAAVENWGLILNNQMDDFSTQLGKPNAYGLTQSARNGIQPYKRPLSSMSPTIVLKHGRPVLLLGGSGGPRIISSVLGVFLYVTDFGMRLQDAIAAMRVHHQWQPDVVFFDRPPTIEWTEALRARGHTLSKRRKTAVIQAIQLEGSQLRGASDPRKGGRPAGY